MYFYSWSHRLLKYINSAYSLLAANIIQLAPSIFQQKDVGQKEASFSLVHK